jgi:hypothetical protein
MLSSRPGEFEKAGRLLERRFGPVEAESETFPFDVTTYYDAELGTPVARRFLSFEQLVSPGALAAIKRFTNEVEQLRAREAGTQPSRPVNLDPGYLDAARLVLATTKDRAHRVYLDQGIYAEVTLLYERKAWRPVPWTYRDYAGNTYHPFLSEARARYLEKLRTSR